MTLDNLIIECQRDNPKAQKELYDNYKDLLFGITRRYIKNHHEAEDIFIHSMFKIFDKVNSFQFKGSFEGWMKRLVVNECLMHLRKPIHKLHFRDVEERDKAENINVVNQLLSEDIIGLLDKLPEGYRAVFNLYAIEGYKHKEIAEKLNISINTSKSQYFLAKRKMREILKIYYDK